MANDVEAGLYGRSFLTLRDYSAGEIEALLGLAARLKVEKHEHREVHRLDGRSIALIFEKDSTRTRIGFEVAAYDQGAHVTYLGPSGSHVGKKESVKDTARVLGRVYDAIEFRGRQRRARFDVDDDVLDVLARLRLDSAHPLAETFEEGFAE